MCAQKKRYAFTADKMGSPLNMVFVAPDAATANQAFKAELNDQLYQTYLMSMPERSYRKQFLHAEKVTGFSADVFRNFKISATKIANQAAKQK